MKPHKYSIHDITHLTICVKYIQHHYEKSAFMHCLQDTYRVMYLF